MTTATCEHCTAARLGMYFGYSGFCAGCRARLVARCCPMFQAMTGRCTSEERRQAHIEVRQRISGALPGMPYDEARALVMGWWTSDQVNRGEVPHSEVAR